MSPVRPWPTTLALPDLLGLFFILCLVSISNTSVQIVTPGVELHPSETKIEVTCICSTSQELCTQMYELGDDFIKERKFFHKFWCLFLCLYIQYIPRIMHRVCTLFCFVAVGYKLAWTISFRVTSLELGQSYDCPSASEATLKDVGKYGTSIHRNWLYSNKTKHK